MSLQRQPNSEGDHTPAHEGVDSLLAERLAAGDEAVLNEILQLYWKPIVRYVAAYVNCIDTAQDIAQESFARLWRQRRQWLPGRSVRPFLFRVAHNLACNERRSARVRSQWVTSEMACQGAASPSASQVYEAESLDGALARAVAALPERRRHVFVLARFDGLSYREIGEVLGISTQTVANQMSAALADLRRVLAPYLGDSTRAAKSSARLRHG
jgi:RNA polymerase sigma-70 factor (ECF subfamily)